MSRIYNKIENLNPLEVKSFFENRSKRIDELGLLTVTMYQNEELARKRDAHEKETVLPYLKIKPSSRVFDIGCGTGRWGYCLANKVSVYLGTDFCAAYIKAAQKNFDYAGYNKATHVFQCLSATEITALNLAIVPPFDISLVCGLMPFLNDSDVRSLLHKIIEFSAPEATLYIREPVAKKERLTLKEHFSEELNDNYHAIYRTVKEYEDLFNEILVPAGFHLHHTSPLYPPELCNRAETEQYIFILKKA
jgi:SAM-dependent methyltransferase